VATLIASKKSLKIKTSSYLKLINYKRQGKRKNNLIQGPANVKDFIQQQKKQDEMMKEFARR
jgi:hypothetical protein